MTRRLLLTIIAIELVAMGAVSIVLVRAIRSEREAREQVGELTAQIADLEGQIVLMQEPGEGGAEIDAPEIQPTGPGWVWPIAESDYLMLTSPHGYRVSPILHVERWHQGVDIAASWRAQVVAARDGIVAEHWPVPGTPYPGGGVYRGHDVYGGLVIIEHDDGWRSLYAHLSSSRVMTGQRVQAGEIIGRVGDTGQARGNHLHWELIDVDGERVNPLLYVEPRE